jgi:hypothetical protein
MYRGNVWAFNAYFIADSRTPYTANLFFTLESKELRRKQDNAERERMRKYYFRVRFEVM